MELGLHSFVDWMPDPSTGEQIDAGTRMRNLVEEIELADQVGLDVFGVGEHHRPDYLASSPAVVLAAAASRTSRIRLTSAVTVLSSDDPVRVFQDFATLDLLSGGRAEIMAGRGSFIESFPLFGLSLDDYDLLFADRLELLLKLREAETITWHGRTRPRIDGLGVYPRPVQDPLPVWLAVGGTPQSAVRAGMLGLPLAIAIIGGEPARFAPFVDIYHQAWARAGRDPAQARVGVNVHGFIADTAAAAADLAFPGFAQTMTRIGRERGWPPTTRAKFDAGRREDGHLLVGDPEEVAEKIIRQHEHLRFDRYLVQMSVGPVPHDAMLHAIELFGTKVAPAVRRALAG